MDGSAAIERNREALKRILAMLVSMAGMADGGSTLPRRLHRAILRLLRPAEAAARRLIIAAARGIVVALPAVRMRKPKPAIGRGPRAFMPVMPKKHRQCSPHARNLPLLDPPRRPFRPCFHYTPAHAAPRILSLDAPFRPLPQPPSPDDPVDAARLALRLDALGRALDDLPGQARRFAVWKARNDAARQNPAAGRFPRSAPLRRGRPPGGRLSRYEPSADHPRRIREIDEILAHAHALAVYALEFSDTS